MFNRLGILMAVALVAGCTTAGTAAPPPKPSSNLYAGCNQPIWSWCLAQRAR